MNCDAVRAQLRECSLDQIEHIEHLRDCPGCGALAEAIRQDHAALSSAIEQWVDQAPPIATAPSRSSIGRIVVVALAIAATLAFAASTLLPGGAPPIRPATTPPIEAVPESEAQHPQRTETEPPARTRKDRRTVPSPSPRRSPLPRASPSPR